MSSIKINRLIVLLLIVVLGFSSVSFATENQELVYVIPLKEEITKASEKYVQMSIDEAERMEAKKIIIELDTYGGLVDSAEKIKKHINSTDIETICYINSKAESAGVLIALSCDKIFMSPYATIGSAETIPNTEKILSMWKSMLRNAAQNSGRDPQVVEAMADVDVEIEGVSERGKLLNLTSQEALELGISDGEAVGLDNVLASVDVENPQLETIEEDFSTKVAKFLSQQWISSLLLVIGITALIIEFFIPGFGVFGIVGALSLFLFFGSNVLVGNATWFSLMFFILGAILIVVELFVPGFGLPGISGIILTILGITTSMQTLEQAFMAILIALIVGALSIFVIFKYGLNSRTFKNITLEKSIQGNSNIDVLEKKLIRIGDMGRSLTVMRPYGFIEINGEKFDATAESNFIGKNSVVEVIGLKGNTIIVKEIN